MEGKRSEQRFVHWPVEIKDWLHGVPGVDEARPGRCPCCGTAARPAGAKLVIQGHGVRARQVRGPRAPGAPPETVVLTLRRYLCLRCGAVIVVGPQGLLRGWLYSAPAMAWALWLYGVARRTAAQVRRQVSAWPTVGATAAAGWAALRRWARAVRRRVLFPAVRPSPESFSLRQVAARAATTAAACAPPADREQPPEHQAWRGALQLARAIAM